MAPRCLIAFILCVATPLAASAQTSPALVQAEGQSLRASCGAGDARVEGNHNVVVLTGPCRGLQLNGVGNQVTIDLRDGATVRIEGSANRVTYRLRAGAAPAVVALGPDNLVHPDAMPPAALPVTIPAPSPARGALELPGDDQQRAVDCAGRDVVIRGVRSAYVLRGGCRSVAVSGSLDTIQAEMAAGGQVLVEGDGITLAWAVLVPGAGVTARVHGSDSRVRRTSVIDGQPVRRDRTQ